jgi:hypothetical protein
VAGSNTIELQHLSLEVKTEVRTNYGSKHEVEGGDEYKDNDGNVRKETPNDSNTLI